MEYDLRVAKSVIYQRENKITSKRWSSEMNRCGLESRLNLMVMDNLEFITPTDGLPLVDLGIMKIYQSSYRLKILTFIAVFAFGVSNPE